MTDKRFPGNPTRSYRTKDPVKVVGELEDWVGHSPAQIQAMLDGLADLERRGQAVIDDETRPHVAAQASAGSCRTHAATSAIAKGLVESTGRNGPMPVGPIWSAASRMRMPPRSHGRRSGARRQRPDGAGEPGTIIPARQLTTDQRVIGQPVIFFGRAGA